MTVEDVYEEFTSQGYNVVFNPDGNGDCQFSAIAHHLASIGIYCSERTIREEICQYLEQNPSDTDGFPVRTFCRCSVKPMPISRKYGSERH